MTDEELELLLLEAGASEHGLLVRTSDVPALRQKLYRLLKKPGMPALTLTPDRQQPEELLFLLKKDQANAPE
jgi:hypothetical protein